MSRAKKLSEICPLLAENCDNYKELAHISASLARQHNAPQPHRIPPLFRIPATAPN